MKPNVLFVASTFSHIRNFHRPYLREFIRRGWQVDIACGGEEISVPEARRSIHIPLEKSMTSPKNLTATRLLRQEILTEKYALISCHTALAAFFVRLAVMGMKRRPLVVCISHGYLFDDDTSAAKRLLLAGAEKLTAPVTDLLMTMNGWDTQYAQKHRLGKAVRYIPGMGVDFSRMDPYLLGTDDTLRTELGFGPEHFLLVYAAEFSARKNQSTLLHALTQLPEQVVLLLPGNGTLLEECKALAQHLGVAHRVVFPGHVSEMPRWYAAADAAVAFCA